MSQKKDEKGLFIKKEITKAHSMRLTPQEKNAIMLERLMEVFKSLEEKNSKKEVSIKKWKREAKIQDFNDEEFKMYSRFIIDGGYIYEARLGFYRRVKDEQ